MWGIRVFRTNSLKPLSDTELATDENECAILDDQLLDPRVLYSSQFEHPSRQAHVCGVRSQSSPRPQQCNYHLPL